MTIISDILICYSCGSQCSHSGRAGVPQRAAIIAGRLTCSDLAPGLVALAAGLWVKEVVLALRPPSKVPVADLSTHRPGLVSHKVLLGLSRGL